MFDDKKITLLITKLVHAQLYDCLNDGIYNTKDDIMERIAEYKMIMPKCKDPESAETAMEELQYYYDAAPDEKTPSSGVPEFVGYFNFFGEWEVSDRVKSLMGMAHSDVGYEMFSVRNTIDTLDSQVSYVREPDYGAAVNGIGSYYTAAEIEEGTSAGTMGSIFFKTSDLASIPDISITKEEAVKQADGLVSILNEDYMECCVAEKVYGGSWDNVSASLFGSDIAEQLGVETFGTGIGYGTKNPLRCLWRLRYARTVSGIPATYTMENGNGTADEDVDPNDSCKDSGLNPPWQFEEMNIYVDDSGIVGFEWASPYELDGIALENSALKPFDEIMEKFKEMMTMKYGDFVDEGCAVERRINEIRFGLCRVTEQNKRDTGLLIPVWDFFGQVIYSKDDGTGTIISVNEQSYDRSIMTINAIDGSIIDRGLGY